MTFDSFIAKYTGKGIDFDGSFGNQCVDLYRQYLKEVLGLPQSPFVSGAKDIFDSYLKDKFIRVSNTLTGVPNKGDVIIWGTKIGEYGHVAIFINGGSDRFNSFDQNFPLNSKCHTQSHVYNGVLGWLHPLNATINEVPMWLKQMFSEQGIDIAKPEGEVRGRVQEVFDGWKKYGELETKVIKLNKDLSFQAGQAAEFEQRLLISEGQVKDLQRSVQDARDGITSRDVEISVLQGKVATMEKLINPDTQVVISKDEYSRLKSTAVLDRFTAKELLTKAISKLLGR